MKSNFLSLAMALSASLSVGSITAKPIVEPVQQNCLSETKSTSIEIMPMEGSESEIIEKDRPKPTKKKRHIVGKVIIGLAIAWGVVVVVFIASYGAAQH